MEYCNVRDFNILLSEMATSSGQRINTQAEAEQYHRPNRPTRPMKDIPPSRRTCILLTSTQNMFVDRSYVRPQYKSKQIQDGRNYIKYLFHLQRKR